MQTRWNRYSDGTSPQFNACVVYHIISQLCRQQGCQFCIELRQLGIYLYMPACHRFNYKKVPNTFFIFSRKLTNTSRRNSTQRFGENIKLSNSGSLICGSKGPIFMKYDKNLMRFSPLKADVVITLEGFNRYGFLFDRDINHVGPIVKAIMPHMT